MLHHQDSPRALLIPRKAQTTAIVGGDGDSHNELTGPYRDNRRSRSCSAIKVIPSVATENAQQQSSGGSVDQAMFEQMVEVLRPEAIAVGQSGVDLYEEPFMVAPGLLVGHAKIAANEGLLDAFGVTRVLSLKESSDITVRSDASDYVPEEMHSVSRGMHDLDPGGKAEKRREVVSYPLEDDLRFNLESHLPACTRIIAEWHKQGHTVLVHCDRGKNRAPCVAAAYMVSEHQEPLFPVIAMMRSAQPGLFRNSTFLKHLVNWEQKYHSKITVSYSAIEEAFSKDA